MLRALTERQEDGLGRELRFSLAGTASWLLHDVVPEPVPEGDHDAEAWLTEASSPYGRLRYALPPIHYEGGPADWRHPAGRWGTDPAAWA